MVVRENTGGIYTGMGGATMVGTQNEIATQVMLYSRPVVERCVRYAYDYTRKRNNEEDPDARAQVQCADATAATCGCARTRKWATRDYPDIKQDYNHVDACTMWMVKSPELYDVIVTENLFGDIITDLGAMIQGGMGIAAGGNINPEGVSMFEPIGGSAPKYTGKNVINPLAAICAGGMMLETLGETAAAATRSTRRVHDAPCIGQDQEPGRRQDGHGHHRGRRPGRVDGEIENKVRSRDFNRNSCSMSTQKKITVYDTTLRDGNQALGINLSLSDKLRIAQRLSDAGFHYIEGGWPNPTNAVDTEFFKKVKKLGLRAKIAVFGSTKGPMPPAARTRFSRCLSNQRHRSPRYSASHGTCTSEK